MTPSSSAVTPAMEYDIRGGPSTSGKLFTKGSNKERSPDKLELDIRKNRGCQYRPARAREAASFQHFISSWCLNRMYSHPGREGKYQPLSGESANHSLQKSSSFPDNCSNLHPDATKSRRSGCWQGGTESLPLLTNF